MQVGKLMATKTKVFISSSAQDALKDLREETFASITALGHEVLMFEKADFGPWPTHDKDSINHCLDMVDKSTFSFYTYRINQVHILKKKEEL